MYFFLGMALIQAAKWKKNFVLVQECKGSGAFEHYNLET